jgi:hypothetical protein
MNVGKVGFAPIYSNPIGFRGDNSSKTEYENPVSRPMERNLAILASSSGSLLLGAIGYGLSTFVLPTEKITEKSFSGFCKAKKYPLIGGAIVTAISLLVSLPPAIYGAKVNAFARQKEMDVFSRDRSLKSNLTEEVDNEVKNNKVSLDKKLDDNLKLQMANRGAAIGIANVTSQQG